MKRKVTSICLSALLLVSSLSLLAACDDDEAESSDVVTLKTEAPVCFVGNEYTDSSLSEDTFTVTYDSSLSLTAQIQDSSLATLSEVSSSDSDGVKTVTYSVTSKGTEGESEIEFLDGSEVVDTVSVKVKSAYPETGFNKLNYSTLSNGAAYSHDPTVLEVEEGYTISGKTYYYFSYSTDNEAGYGVPVKASVDMVEWTFLGTCIPDFGSTASAVKSNCEAGTSELQDVYDVLSSDSNWANVWTLWAPEVVPAYGGGYWLYGSWTDAFGSRRSIIFQCYSDSPVGPFEYVDMIVYSPSTSNDSKQSNAIDPSIYYDTEGNMYMSYGSFSDFRAIPLDSKTGLRRDGASFTVSEMSSSSTFYADYYDTYTCDWNEYYDELSDSEKYFGEKILSNTNIEGSVINYYENVGVYTGDIATEDYDESKMTYTSSYYLMGSANSLSSNYNMRVFKSSTATGTYTSSYGGSNGNKISGNFTWTLSGGDYSTCAELNHFVPGHNDLLTNSDNENFIIYHNKVAGSEGSLGTQYLYVGLVAFNSKGDLLMSPNRYNGESLRKVTEAEITEYSGGKFLGVNMSSNKLGTIYYAEEYSINADGTITGAEDGTWKLYGDNYIYISMGGYEFYGVVMPTYCLKADETAKRGYTGQGGLAISAIAYNGGDQRTLFMQMSF